MLLDDLAAVSGYEKVSDLKILNSRACRRMKTYLDETPSISIPLRDLNEALSYMFGRGPEVTPEAAKFMLINCLMYEIPA